MMHAFYAPSDAASDCLSGRSKGSESAELIEETLIEEVSIDGMCGVY